MGRSHRMNSYFLIDGEVMKITQVSNVSFLTALTIATSSIAQERKIKRSSPASAVEKTLAAQQILKD
jgi:hypothetical protein